MTIDHESATNQGYIPASDEATFDVILGFCHALRNLKFIRDYWVSGVYRKYPDGGHGRVTCIGSNIKVDARSQPDGD